MKVTDLVGASTVAVGRKHLGVFKDLGLPPDEQNSLLGHFGVIILLLILFLATGWNPLRLFPEINTFFEV